MTLTTSFTQFDVLMVQITNLTDSCIASLSNQSNFTRGQTNLSKITFFCQYLSCSTCRSYHLASTAFLEFNIVNQCSQWYS